MSCSSSSLQLVVLYLVFRSPISPSLVQSPCSRVIICNPFGALFNFHTFHVKSHEYWASCVGRLMGFAPSMLLRTLVKHCPRQQLYIVSKKNIYIYKYIFNYGFDYECVCLARIMQGLKIQQSFHLCSLAHALSEFNF